jgi:hypothetical protein
MATRSSWTHHCGEITDTEVGGHLMVAVPVSANGEVVGWCAEQSLGSVQLHV